MRRTAFVIGILLIVMGFSTGVSSEVGWDNPLAVFITYEQMDYDIGSEVEVTVHVFREGDYYDPDEVNLTIGAQWREIELTKQSTGKYLGTFTIEEDDVDWGEVFLEALVSDGLVMTEEAEAWAYITFGYYLEDFVMDLKLDQGDDYMAVPGQDIELRLVLTYQDDPVDPDPGTLDVTVYNHYGEGVDTVTLTKVTVGEYEGTFIVPVDLDVATEFEIEASADYTYMSETYYGYDSESVIVTFFDLWIHYRDITTSRAEIDIFVVAKDGSMVEGADVEYEYYYDDDDWETHEGLASGTTDSDGKVTLILTYSELGVYEGIIWADCTVDVDGAVQYFEDWIMVREYGSGDMEGFWVEVLNGESVDPDTDVTLEMEATYGDDPMASQAIHVYVVTNGDLLHYGTSTTNSQGEFQVTIHTPSITGAGDEAYTVLTIYFQTRHMGSWESIDSWLLVGDLNFEYAQYLDEDTVLSVEPFRPGGVVEVTLVCPEADGVDEEARLNWGLGDIDDWMNEGESQLEWGLVSGWGSVWMPSLNLAMTWDNGAYHTSFVFPPFLGSDMTISFLGGVLFSEYPVMDARLDILEGVQPLPPNEPPEVTITTPVDGQSFTDALTVSGTAMDDEAVMTVEYQVDGGDWTEADGDETWTFDMAISSLASGDHNLVVRSYDGEMYSTLISADFVVDRPPGVALTFPVAGVILNGSVPFTGTATDDMNIQWVEYRIDGGDWLLTDGNETWTALIDTTKLTKGDHTFEVRTFDGLTYSDTSDVTFGADQPPTVDIRAHEDGMKYKDKADFMGVASDDGDVVKVELRIDGGEWMEVIGTTDWDFKATEVKLSEGTHTLDVRSFDGTQYSEVQSTTFVYEKKDEEPGFGTVAAIVAILAMVPAVWWRRRR